MFYMPCEKVNICKKSRRAGAELGGALSNLPCHGLAGSLATEGMNRLCLHQVALFGVCRSCVECFDNDARNKHGVCCLCCCEPKQWHHDRPIATVKIKLFLLFFCLLFIYFLFFFHLFLLVGG